MTEENLIGKVAVITGSTQGLGLAIAQLFAQQKVSGLVICGRNRQNGEKAASIMVNQGIPTQFVRADLSDVEACRKVIRKADQAFGKVDILINSAAITDRGTILDTSEELFDRMFAINTRAPFFLIQEAAKIMIREKIEGTIVNIQSMAAHGGQPFITAYCASKGALSIVTKNSAFSLMRNKIRVNALNIGWMDTPGEDRIQKEYHKADPDWLAKAEASQPFARLLKTNEVARAVLFLASADSGMMTGSIVDFDQSVLGCYESPPHPIGTA
jgi:NAD(P)-dependent dehydrogenase (short-subunit alcohol dehydrogenase family)